MLFFWLWMQSFDGKLKAESGKTVCGAVLLNADGNDTVLISVWRVPSAVVLVVFLQSSLYLSGQCDLE